MTKKIDSNVVWAQAQDRLRGLKSAHRLRQDRLCELADEKDTGIYRIVDGKEVVNFCSNDYLDLAHHPDVKKAAIKATEKYGSGAMASRLICGTLQIHCELEQALADFKQTESALVFSSGYLACQGAVQVLSRRADDSMVPVLFDRLCHASLIDAATRDRRNWRSFPHNDMDSLELLLKKNKSPDWPSALVVTEGIFSMDGDLAPLKEMSDLCARHHAIMLVDDAHGTGTIGKNGSGCVELAGLTGAPHIVQIGTLSKAIGSQGGFVAGPAILRELLVNRARTFIFDTGLNPSATAAAVAALKIIKEEPQRRKKLHENVVTFHSVLNRLSCKNNLISPIIPVLMANEESSVKAADQLTNQGYLVVAIRPPTVPEGTSRLRVTLSSAHKEKDIREMGQEISNVEISSTGIH